MEDYRELRRLFMENGVVLGQSATREKWHAVLIGDTSWTVVHPALVHIAQLFGARIVNRMRPHMQPIDEDTHLNVALMLLSMPPMTIADAITHIQCCCLLSVHYMKFDLHITPPIEGQQRSNPSAYLGEDCPYRLLVATDDDDEKRDVLCQLLYIDSVCSLRMRLPPLLAPQLRQEFETLLYPQLHYLTQMKEASMTVIRMASIALLHEARMVMTEGSSPGSPAISSTSGVPSPFAAIIRRIHLYLADLNELVLAIPPTPTDRPRYLMLQQCTLVPATALASIYHLLTPTHPELQRKCVDAVAEIVGISDALTPDDCSQLDPVISVCWSIALNITMQIQQQIVERNLRDPGYYSGIQLGQLPTFIDVLRTCAQKVKWPFPLVGGISLNHYAHSRQIAFLYTSACTVQSDI
ncbi:hypothetical protein BKA70DRAFT_1431483 [Coprinopsis sp. MPI-PUGE-AT-0042]|nr:hypothetical protein BKA70DRAFT_1431483 [Coprinopsis sp. MPI-PUGE-AT-0042]